MLILLLLRPESNATHFFLGPILLDKNDILRAVFLNI
jgi:hypothetical protein